MESSMESSNVTAATFAIGNGKRDTRETAQATCKRGAKYEKLTMGDTMQGPISLP